MQSKEERCQCDIMQNSHLDVDSELARRDEFFGEMRFDRKDDGHSKFGTLAQVDDCRIMEEVYDPIIQQAQRRQYNVEKMETVTSSGTRDEEELYAIIERSQRDCKVGVCRS